jgi:hypothetical protein
MDWLVVLIRKTYRGEPRKGRDFPAFEKSAGKTLSPAYFLVVLTCVTLIATGSLAGKVSLNASSNLSFSCLRFAFAILLAEAVRLCASGFFIELVGILLPLWWHADKVPHEAWCMYIRMILIFKKTYMSVQNNSSIGII